MRNTESRLRWSKAVILLFIVSSLAQLVCAGPSDANSLLEPGEDQGGSVPWPYHFFMASLGAVTIAGGWLVAWRMRKTKGWVNLHKKMTLLGTGFILIGIAIAFYMVATYYGTYFVREVHPYLGASVFVFVIITPILGFLQFRVKDRRIHEIHRWSGRLTLALIFAAFSSGVLMMLAD